MAQSLVQQPLTFTKAETFGYHEESGAEITITGRIRQSTWTTGTNSRDWAVYDENNELITSGYAEGLRNAKIAALQSLNDHFAASGGYTAVQENS